MVHLAPDSRLLVSLVKQEQAYATQLHNLLNASGTSISALAVYASSAPPTISAVLNGVAGALSGADEALRTYGEALNDWIDQLGSIKHKEEEVVNIGRDREILVTRLLKASQKSKSPPQSLLHLAPPDPSSSSSFPSFNSKITAAQTELQACESHLAEKERELEKLRIHAVRQGLKVRCNALVHCGWQWGEMGRRALSILDGLDGAPPSNGYVPEFFKPLPDPTREPDHDSLMSSLAPSQSASQTGLPFSTPSVPERGYSLDIPPPHLVTEHHGIPRQRAQESGSSSEEDEGPVEAHDNPRFQPATILNRQSKITRTAPSTPARSSPVPFPSPGKGRSSNSDIGPSGPSTKQKRDRERKHTSFLGSLASLFRTSVKPGVSQAEGQWNTRTERNLRNAKSDGEQSSDEEDRQPRSGRLRKGKNRGSTLDENRNGWANAGANSAEATPPSQTALKKRKSGGKLGRSGTVRSTVSEPGTAPRGRANTLGSSSGPSPAAVTATARTHGRTASMDGRWGLSDMGSLSNGSLQNISPASTWKPPKPAAASKGDSLMSIVEDVTRTNQAARSRSFDDPSSRLETVRAPGSSVPRLPLLVHPPPPLPGPSSAPSSPKQKSSKLMEPRRASMPVQPKPTLNVPLRPLRSALRNPNRSASPSPSPSPDARATESDLSSSPSGLPPLSLPGPASPAVTARPMSLTRLEVPSTIIESPRQSYASNKTDDSASISSYETGHENFDDEVEPEVLTPTAPAPPPKSEKVAPPSPQDPFPQAAPNGSTDQHEVSSATSTDTATGSAPTRRKSVRMSSLPPQVSATPPALDEYDDVSRSPWGPSRAAKSQPGRDEGWSTRTPTTNIGWEDSSDEDQEYKAARQALSRADRRSEKKRR